MRKIFWTITFKYADVSHYLRGDASTQNPTWTVNVDVAAHFPRRKDAEFFFRLICRQYAYGSVFMEKHIQS